MDERERERERERAGRRGPKLGKQTGLRKDDEQKGER